MDAVSLFYQQPMKGNMMELQTIHIVINEPTTDHGVGGFEWRLDREEAEKAFRELRGIDSITYLFTDVTVPVAERTDAETVTEWVDSIYWGYSHTPELMYQFFGKKPTRTYSV